jgi:molybdopterin-biosynthesis enzyme MoeA-like protein
MRAMIASTPPSPHALNTLKGFGLIIVGDEILSGKRADKHLSKVIELLSARGLALEMAEYVGDDPQRITDSLRRAFHSGMVVFSCGGIGATPDDHTRQCAGNALGLPLALQPQAKGFILERIRDQAVEQGVAYEPDRPEHLHRLNMAMFPQGAEVIPNPYNKIAGFTCHGPRSPVHFVPGFPVMAWPMMEWVLDTFYAPWFHVAEKIEKSIVIYGGMEATLTPLMQSIEARFDGAKVFSLPSVDHPVHGRHVELGVKGLVDVVELAYPAMLEGLKAFDFQTGPEMVRK